MFGDKADSKKYLEVGKDGATLAIVGEEQTGHASFDESKKRYVFDAAGGFRFGVNAWDGAVVVVLEGGWRMYKAIAGIVKKDGPSTLIRVTPSGSGMDKQFTAEAVRQLTVEEQEQIAAAGVHDLAKELPWLKAVATDDIPF
jgi:hypothetical protein